MEDILKDIDFNVIKQIIEEEKKMKKGIVKTVECTSCKGKLEITKSEYNGHIYAKCRGCGVELRQ